MISETYKVINKDGLPARLATVLVNVTSEFEAKIKFIVNDREADAKSIINLMALHIKYDDELTINVEGTDGYKAFEAVKKTLEEMQVIKA